MNFNIYLEDKIAEQIQRLVRLTGKKRNAIVREALEAWVKEHSGQYWSESILKFEGIDDAIAFEKYRDELIQPDDRGIFS